MMRTRSSRRTRTTGTRRTSRRLRVNTQNDESCIDLTVTADESFVDLTEASVEDEDVPETNAQGANDNSVVIIETPDVSPSRRRRQRHRNRVPRQIEIADDDDDLFPDPELPPFQQGIANAASSPEPEPITISCPVCFDDDKTIKKSKRKLTSTVCGHLFCDSCINAAVRAQHSCPVCRKRLILSQLHVLHI